MRIRISWLKALEGLLESNSPSRRVLDFLIELKLIPHL